MELLKPGYQKIVDDIAGLRWSELNQDELLAVAQAYYYFSVQFCETVEIACRHYPDDRQLDTLRDGECNTDNLSPYPGVAEPGEKLNHDEFMRRSLTFSPLDRNEKARVDRLGAEYLAKLRRADAQTRIMSLPSYEDGGLEAVFSAVLHARDWNGVALQAFHHFLLGHIKLDSDPDAGHGSLCRHLVPDDRIIPLWAAFRDLLTEAAPKLLH
jgi:hypothetical protein